MSRLSMKWKEANGAAIQFGGDFVVNNLRELEVALDRLEESTAEDTFDLLVQELAETETVADSMVLREILSLEHGYPETLADDLRAMFE